MANTSASSTVRGLMSYGASQSSIAASRSLDKQLTSARKASRSSGRASVGMTIFESDSRTLVMPNTQF